MDTYTFFPYWFILLVLVLNAFAVRYIEIDIDAEETHPSEQHD